MSINWVMMAANPAGGGLPFTPLPSESTLYTSPPRTSFAISSLGKFPGQQPFSLSSSSGTLYLTSKRIIYLPATPTPTLQSFACPLLNLQDSHVSAPWIGPNVWTALVRPVQGGNLDRQVAAAALEAKITFRDGGAYDFQSRYETVRERVAHAMELARARGQDVGGRQDGGNGRGPGSMGVEVVMEDLPRYEDAGNSRRVDGDARVEAAPAAAPAAAVPAAPTAAPATQHGTQDDDAGDEEEGGRGQVFTPPDEPPPGYEQVQREVIEDEFSRRLTEATLGRDDEESPPPSIGPSR